MTRNITSVSSLAFIIAWCHIWCQMNFACVYYDLPAIFRTSDTAHEISPRTMSAYQIPFASA